MHSKQPIQISVESALRLVDVIREQVKRADSELVKKILLRAGIKIADLALEGESTSRRGRRAA